ncbi:MAG: hypothetical protein LUH51_00385 [Firmicutes bacterium]|nr:hypothetical protein [Bacillota bacterium]
MEIQHYGNHQPENVLLLGNGAPQKARAEAIVSEAKKQHPEWFEGNKPSFCFELRYAAPFDKSFGELKRLQGIAAEAAGRRDTFHGYILIDLSNYLGHEEAFFQITLQFLADMSDCWKYIFFADNKNQREAKALVSKTLTILLRDIPCDVEEPEENPPAPKKVDTMLEKQSIYCDSLVKELLCKLMDEEGFCEDTVFALLQDLRGYCGNRINASKLADFFAKREPIVKYILPQKEYERLMKALDSQREVWYGEKEAI